MDVVRGSSTHRSDRGRCPLAFSQRCQSSHKTRQPSPANGGFRKQFFSPFTGSDPLIVTQRRPSAHIHSQSRGDLRTPVRLTTSPSCADNDAMSPSTANYRSRVLNLKAPVSVTLARKRVALSGVLDIVPGTMLTFEKTCDELLELEVGGHPIATGEAVKVGDKFGLRIRTLGRPQTE
ncbi:Flagellar motor switch protein FliN [Roseimaritima ulvae]|uniref:Flagellar motor switch protein FliN n=2 Tax=Roseimaritima ulvae TaxID=980254 RepID=A0A5B9R6Q0_9BACT|nr:Flagellar motor switch protein FliN [Roseimaritima ulvae]